MIFWLEKNWLIFGITAVSILNILDHYWRQILFKNFIQKFSKKSKKIAFFQNPEYDKELDKKLWFSSNHEYTKHFLMNFFWNSCALTHHFYRNVHFLITFLYITLEKTKFQKLKKFWHYYNFPFELWFFFTICTKKSRILNQNDSNFIFFWTILHFMQPNLYFLNIFIKVRQSKIQIMCSILLSKDSKNTKRTWAKKIKF